MTTIEVPVFLLIEAQDMGSFLEGILQSDGRLRVTVCPYCYSLLPPQRLPEHIEILGH
jgi:hypothetical protein